MEIRYPYIVLLLLCILSRLLSSIYYIEDPDSLRFALCVADKFDLASLQPNFPGYPIFCVIAKALYLVIGSFSISFSIIGGIAVYCIILYVLKLLNIPLLSMEGVLTSVFIFFNPMIWIMSNNYLPDLAGVAMTIAAFYYLMLDPGESKLTNTGWLLTGLLNGVKLTCTPFLIVPCIYTFFKHKKYFQSTIYLLVGIGVWLVPLILVTGWNDFTEGALLQFENHFNDFDGTLFSQNSYGWKMARFVQSIWADGLGGYWIDRTPALLLGSIGIFACSIFGFLILLNFDFNKSKAGILLLSCLFYSIWVIFFQNIIANSRHVLLLMPFLSILISYGIIYFLVNFNFVYIKVLALLFTLSFIFLTVVLAVQHTYPTAVSQAKEYIISKKEVGEKVTIVSIPLINKYLESQDVSANYISVPPDSLSNALSKIQTFKGRVMLIGKSPLQLKGKPLNTMHFSHNPYVNRVWADLYLYEYMIGE